MKSKLLIVLIVMTCSLSGCGKTVDTVKNIATESVQTETISLNTETKESVNSTEISTETTIGTDSLESYLGCWVYYISEDEWVEAILSHEDGHGNENNETIYATVTQYSSSGEGSYTTDCENEAVDETNTAGADPNFRYKFTPDGDKLETTVIYPEGAEFEDAEDIVYVLEKEDDENLGYMERDIKFMYDSKLASASDTSEKNTENEADTNVSEETTPKYADGDLIAAAEGFMDIAVADSIQRTHTSYEVDSVTSVERYDESGNYSVKFYILFDGHTYEYLTIRLMDTSRGLEYSGAY